MLIEVNDIKLNVETHGSGEPLLLLHGFTGSVRSWDRFIPKWSQHAQVIAVDIIGHGQSDSPADPKRYSMEKAVQDLIALFDTLQVHKANVLGYSMGGRLALSLAVMHPERVNSLILESSSPGLLTEEERTARMMSDEQLADRIEREGMERFTAFWENIPLFESVKRMPEETQRSIRQGRLRNQPLGLANSLRGMGTGAQPSWWGHLAALKMPVHFIAGEWDKKFDEIAQTMNSAVTKGQYTQVPGAGHLVHVEQAHSFDTIVTKCLNFEE